MGVLALVVSALVLGAVGVATGALWSRGSLNGLICDGACGPSALATPDGLSRDGTPASAVPGRPADGRLDADAIAAAVRDQLGDDALGAHVGFAAVDPATGELVASEGSGTFVPASTTKLLTGLATLTELEPQQRFTTRVVSDGDRIVLIGGGDPYLATKAPQRTVYAVEADLTTLARRTAAALRRAGTTSVRLDYEAELFTGPDASPTWESSYVRDDIVSPVGSLWVDEGITGGGRADDPAWEAAKVFARLLRNRGIDVIDTPIQARATSAAQPLAHVRSATVAQITEAMIARSDNEAAEVLLRHVALEAGLPASFDGGVESVRSVLQRLDIDTSDLVLHDGSGLSRANRIAPRTLAELVAVAASTPRTAGLVSDLAVGGFTGTLARRFGSARNGLGVVRGKSGTLTGVHSLAGYVTDRSGTPIAFAVMTDRTKSVNPFVTELALDRVTAALARCSCSTPAVTDD